MSEIPPRQGPPLSGAGPADESPVLDTEVATTVEDLGVPLTHPPTVRVSPCRRPEASRLRLPSSSSEASEEELDGPLTRPTLPRLVLSGEEAEGEVFDLAVGRVLGQGGMGVVFLAQQASLHRDVAVKRLRPYCESRHAMARLLREAQLSGSLEHPNIIPVHALGVDGQGLPLMVMKKVDGVCWCDLLYQQDHPAWPPEVTDRQAYHLGILLQVSRAVEYAHVRQVLHRDIKPGNVMIGKYGEVYLLDWGIGVELEGEEAKAGGVAGTPAYMAPEMLLGSNLSLRSDIYLLGATLHEVVTGKPPHAGATLHEVVASAIRGQPKAYGPEVPAELAAICSRAMAPDPDARYATVAELRAALASYLEHRASAEIAQAAAARLAEMRALATAGSTHGTRMHRLFGECRFGFQQALAEWPENPAARAGLAEALEHMAGFQVRAGDAAGAATLLAELEDLGRPQNELRRRIEELQRSLASAHLAKAQLEEIRRAGDLSVASRQRAYVVAALATFMSTLGMAGVERARRAGWQDPSWLSVMVPLGMAIFVLMAVFVGRRGLLSNLVNRRILVGIGVVIGCIGAHRLFALTSGAALTHVILGDGLIVCAAFAVCGATIQPLFYPLAGLMFVAAGLAARIPRWGGHILLGALALCLYMLSYVWWKAGRKSAQAPEPPGQAG